MAPLDGQTHAWFAWLVREHGDVGDADHALQERIRATGMPTERAHQASVVLRELGTNLVRHTPNGGLILARTAGGGDLDIASLDDGPGLDATSTATASLGSGLAAVRRMAHNMRLHAPKAGGAIVHAAWRDADATDRELDAISLAMPGQPACGDNWFAQRTRERTVVAVIDGLGHGERAAEASDAAVRWLREHHATGHPDDLMHGLHTHLRGTRGAAALIAEHVHTTPILRYASVGNIAAGLVSDGHRERLVADPGCVGYGAVRVRMRDVAMRGNTRLTAWSDGVRTPSSETDADVEHLDPVSACLHLMHAHRKTSDDATTLVVDLMAEALS